MRTQNEIKEAMLASIRAAVADSPLRGAEPNSPSTPAPAPVPAVHPSARAESIELFVERIADYKATVVRCGPNEVAASVARLLSAAGSRSVVVPADLPAAWLPTDVTPIIDHQLSHADIEGCDTVITGAALGIALTGTLILDGAATQGRRVLSLLPDHHICVIREDQVRATVPAAVAEMVPSRPSTFISGPSATSDIELDRVEGVHGPRRLDVIVVG